MTESGVTGRKKWAWAFGAQDPPAENMAAAAERMQAMNQELHERTEKIAALGGQLEALQKRLEAASDANAALERMLAAERSARRDEVAGLVARRDVASRGAARVEELERSVAELGARLAAAEAARLEASEAAGRSQAELERARAQVKTLTERLRPLERERARVTGEVKAAAERILSLETELARERGRHETLLAMNAGTRSVAILFARAASLTLERWLGAAGPLAASVAVRDAATSLVGDPAVLESAEAAAAWLEATLVPADTCRSVTLVEDRVALSFDEEEQNDGIAARWIACLAAGLIEAAGGPRRAPTEQEQ